jgi:hypothetical protein
MAVGLIHIILASKNFKGGSVMKSWNKIFITGIFVFILMSGMASTSLASDEAGSALEGSDKSWNAEEDKGYWIEKDEEYQTGENVAIPGYEQNEIANEPIIRDDEQPSDDDKGYRRDSHDDNEPS